MSRCDGRKRRSRARAFLATIGDAIMHTRSWRGGRRRRRRHRRGDASLSQTSNSSSSSNSSEGRKLRRPRVYAWGGTGDECNRDEVAHQAARTRLSTLY